jgi:hypothetical protein
MATNIDKQISELRKVAKEHGLEVRFRNTPNEQGDFCIYIYDKNFRESYAVGYDGDNNGDYGLSFDNCLKMAYKWIDKRDKRFIFREGRWQYGHYHFIIWRDQTSSDREHYLTIEDADRAAADYVKQGYAVVCYDQEPSGRSKLAKVYGNHERHCNDYVKKSIRIFKYNNGDYGPVRK